MFKSPLSFAGRIRRSEWWLSKLIELILWLVCGFLMEVHVILGVPAFVLTLWFALAYHCKRCHDRGNPGYFMIVPFYGLWLAFADSAPGANEYGPNPKVQQQPPPIAP
jgi:uncharacterized membrane protein YhaH (DUF805 family)